MKDFKVICIQKNKTMQDMDAEFLELGVFRSVDGKDIEEKAHFNRDVWRICVIAEER